MTRFSDNDNISRSFLLFNVVKVRLVLVLRLGRESSRQRFFLTVSAHAEMNSNAQGGSISFTYAKHQQEPQGCTVDMSFLSVTFITGPGWLRKTARTQPTASHFLFHFPLYTLTSDGLMLERSEKPIYLHLFVFYGLFLFLIPRFPYWSLDGKQKELRFISYCDLENILGNVNIHRSWHVL